MGFKLKFIVVKDTFSENIIQLISTCLILPIFTRIADDLKLEKQKF